MTLSPSVHLRRQTCQGHEDENISRRENRGENKKILSLYTVGLPPLAIQVQQEKDLTRPLSLAAEFGFLSPNLPNHLPVKWDYFLESRRINQEKHERTKKKMIGTNVKMAR